jgi:hypothetical protein
MESEPLAQIFRPFSNVLAHQFSNILTSAAEESNHISCSVVPRMESPIPIGFYPSIANDAKLSAKRCSRKSNELLPKFRTKGALIVLDARHLDTTNPSSQAFSKGLAQTSYLKRRTLAAMSEADTAFPNDRTSAQLIIRVGGQKIFRINDARNYHSPGAGEFIILLLGGHVVTPLYLGDK